jgi:hypothetical protein
MHHYGEDGVSNRILGVVIKGTAEAWDLRTTPIPSIHRRFRVKLKPGQLVRSIWSPWTKGIVVKETEYGELLIYWFHNNTCVSQSKNCIMQLISPASPQEGESEV